MSFELIGVRADTQAMAELLNTHTITIRRATADDASALRRLAALDDAQAPAAQTDVLIAEDAGELVAAITRCGRAIADPFRRTGELVELLQLRARQV